jgi:hypothetical protein
MVSWGLISANYVRTVPNPKVPHDFPAIAIEMNDNVSDDATLNALKTIEKMVQDVDKEVVKEFGSSMLQDIMVFNEGRTKARLLAPLVLEEERHFNAFEIARRWREAMPIIPGM